FDHQTVFFSHRVHNRVCDQPCGVLLNFCRYLLASYTFHTYSPTTFSNKLDLHSVIEEVESQTENIEARTEIGTRGGSLGLHHSVHCRAGSFPSKLLLKFSLYCALQCCRPLPLALQP